MKIRQWTSLLLLIGCFGFPYASHAQDAAVPLGTPMPALDVKLTSGAGAPSSLGALRGSAYTAIVFWGNKCPWTTRYEGRIQLLSSELSGTGKVLLLVNSNDAAAFPAESAAASTAYAREHGITVPYLTDPTSALAKALGASRAPQAFVFDAAGTLVYSGAIDDSPGDPGNVKKEYLRDALMAISESRPVAVPETKAFGCMIRTVR